MNMWKAHCLLFAFFAAETGNTALTLGGRQTEWQTELATGKD